jgi:hypothetical protein
MKKSYRTNLEVVNSFTVAIYKIGQMIPLNATSVIINKGMWNSFLSYTANYIVVLDSTFIFLYVSSVGIFNS